MAQRILGKEVKIIFLDHCQTGSDGGGPVRTVVYGIVTESARKHLVVTVWDLLDREQHTRDANAESYTIIKSTIEEIHVVKKYNRIK